ncbi:MAG TPA: hypothetical protein VFW78_02275 [Bacteroidia bacterium]|nr:hypothetical protein [Bacteroidia bacterium]
MQRSGFYLVVLVVLLAAGCSEDSNDSLPGTLNYSYFPVNVGHELIYDVTLITKDVFTGNDTAYYQLKEVVESVFTDNQGRPTQRLERYTRADTSQPWIISDVWTVNMTPTLVEKKEENTTYIKMVFPLLDGKVWNGNSLNNLGSQDYSYTFVDQPYTMNTLSFDSTLRVLQVDDDNAVYTLHQEEIFAAGVGLVYKNQINIQKDFPSGIKSQRLYTEKLISWSN